MTNNLKFDYMPDLKTRQTDIDSISGYSKTYILIKFVRPILALSIVMLTFGFLFTLVWKSVPEGNKEIISLAAGYTLGVVSMVAAYYFGTSKDKSDAEQSLRTPNTVTQVTTSQETTDDDKSKENKETKG